MRIAACALSILTLAWFTEIARASDYAIFPTDGPDTDEDGLNDDWEDQVINFYRPELVYSEGEDYWPCTLSYFVTHSTLVYKTLSDPVIANRYLNPQSSIPGNPLNLFAHSTDAPSGIFASTLESDQETDYYLNLTDGDRFANDGNDRFKPFRGIFAQCQMITRPFEVPGNGGEVYATPSSPLIHITYYQFYPFNDYALVPGPIGDHEGDWLFLHVFVHTNVFVVDENRSDAGLYRQRGLYALVYYHHSSAAPCTPTLLTGSTAASYTHDGIPVAYLEKGSHEWYPSTVGFGLIDGQGCSGNILDGKGERYRIGYGGVINLGQRYTLMTRRGEPGSNLVERQLAVFFNGRWGQPKEDLYVMEPGPHGPALDDSLQRELPWRVVYADTHTTKGPGHEGAGSRYYPYLYVAEAAVNSRAGGAIYLPPGHHLGSESHADLIFSNCTVARDPAFDSGDVVITP